MATYTTILHIAADTTEKLRRCDVYRVVEAAQEIGCLADFCFWLSSERPDLTCEIFECKADVAVA